jgi:hypothetical protein
MTGERVTIIYKGQQTGEDELRADIEEEISCEVDNVLVQPGSGQDNKESVRPDGVEILYTLMFPKLFVYGVSAEIFRDATVIVRDQACKVVGSPDYFAAENCPTDWAISVDVRRVEG